MKRINWKTWTGTATFWQTLSKRSLIVFLAGVFCLFGGSLGFILDSSNPQATTAGELTMNILVRRDELKRKDTDRRRLYLVNGVRRQVI